MFFLPTFAKTSSHAKYRKLQHSESYQNARLRRLPRRRRRAGNPPPHALCPRRSQAGRRYRGLHLSRQRGTAHRHHPPPPRHRRRVPVHARQGGERDGRLPRLGPDEGPPRPLQGTEAPHARGPMVSGLCPPRPAHETHHGLGADRQVPRQRAPRIPAERGSRCPRRRRDGNRLPRHRQQPPLGHDLPQRGLPTPRKRRTAEGLRQGGARRRQNRPLPRPLGLSKSRWRGQNHPRRAPDQPRLPRRPRQERPRGDLRPLPVQQEGLQAGCRRALQAATHPPRVGGHPFARR